MSFLTRVAGPAMVVAISIAVSGCSSPASSSSTPAPTGGSLPSGAGASPSPRPSTDLPTGGPVTDEANLCDLLGPGDFEVAGIPGAGLPEMTSDGPGSAYCVYAGDSGGTGGIEFDAFIDDDPEAVYDTIRNEGSEALAALTVPGADMAEGWEGVEGEVGSFARILVRSGKLIFAISAPGGPGMDARLAALAALVVERGSGLAD